MIQQTYKCRKCGSERLYRNGKTKAGKQKFLCKDCKAAGTLEPDSYYTDTEKETILAAYQERASLRGVQRIFGAAPSSILRWLKKSPAPVSASNDPSSGAT